MEEGINTGYVTNTWQINRVTSKYKMFIQKIYFSKIIRRDSV